MKERLQKQMTKNGYDTLIWEEKPAEKTLEIESDDDEELKPQ